MKYYYALLLALAAHLPAQAQTALTFTALPALPDGGRYGMGYCQDANYFYMVGGGSPVSAFTSTVFRFDPTTNTWSSLSSGQLPEHRLGTAVMVPLATPNNLIYVLNAGTPSGPLFDMPTVQAATGQPGVTLANPTPTTTAGTAVWNGLIYTMGGQLAGGVYTNQTRSYNPVTNVWTTLAPMPEAKNTFAAAVNGKIYAVGGYNGVVNSARVDVYDPATNQWQAAATLPSTVSNQAMAVQGEWIWMIGDFNNQGYLAAYNTRTAQLRTFTSNLPPRRNAAAVIRNNRLYVWGGNTAPSNASTLADMWQVDVSSVLASAAPRAAAPHLTAYPNPSPSGRFTLQLPPQTQRVEVRDALGRLVFTATPAAQAPQCPLDLQPQPAGLYTVRVLTSQGLSAPCQLLRQ